MAGNGTLRVRDLHPGMGMAVAERTVMRKDDQGNFETWGDVAARVATGNASLDPRGNVERAGEQALMERLIASGGLLMSGRHLQHGDASQPSRSMEVFTNCSTAATSFLSFLLLLNGSGVGRSYDDDMMLVNWDDAPTVHCVLDEDHADFDANKHLSERDARHMYGHGRDVTWFRVPDDREGWAKALEMVEVAAFERVHKEKLLLLVFSDVRCKGSPIKGMQDRPASGPVPLMNSFAKAMMIRGAGLPRWLQAMYVDHVFAECVLVGGARRAARIAVKHWRDKTVLDFIRCKRPVEYAGLAMEQVIVYRKEVAASGKPLPTAFLWSANNSVMVDEDFWAEADVPGTWASEVFVAATECAYADGTGEPGFINVDKLVHNDDGWADLHRGDYVGSDRYVVKDETHLYLARLAKRARAKRHYMIVNPCGEITISLLGGYCTLACTAPYLLRPDWDDGRVSTWHQAKLDEFNEEWDDEFEVAVRVAVRATIRVNLMDSIYGMEVRRTNRIGPGLTGIHEWMWSRFGLTFTDVVAKPMTVASALMWSTLGRMSRAAYDEAGRYSRTIGVVTPHTVCTIPPAGTISKLFGLTEGAHLPSQAAYLRWVQFRDDDPLVEGHRANGYPVRVLKDYRGHTIVGFPTQQVISEIMPGDKLVVAADASMEDQYRWLELLEYYWIEGRTDNHKWVLRGNQVSYTMKYDPQRVTYPEFVEHLLHHQSRVKVCSVMPTEDTSAYEYLPEEAITKAEFDDLVAKIDRGKEDVDRAHLDCGSSACPAPWNDDKGVVLEGHA